jgi:hypothetical protein
VDEPGICSWKLENPIASGSGRMTGYPEVTELLPDSRQTIQNLRIRVERAA